MILVQTKRPAFLMQVIWITEMTAANCSAAAFVARLQVSQFRCWADADLSANCGPIVLYGPNGSGKTALLEALSYLSPGRGLLSSRLGDIVRKPTNSGNTWAVSADIEATQDHTVGVRLGTGLQFDSAGRERRVYRFEGEAASSSDFADFVRLVWLTPAMDRLFLESAGNRRRFLDRLADSLRPGHAGRVSRYEQAMAERNRLLKDGQNDRAWLEGLERTMAEEGVALGAVRLQTIEALNSEMGGLGAERFTSAFPNAVLSLTGEFENRLRTEPAVQTEQALADALANSRARDAAAGRALTGPHRTDLDVLYVERDCPAGPGLKRRTKGASRRDSHGTCQTGCPILGAFTRCTLR